MIQTFGLKSVFSNRMIYNPYNDFLKMVRDKNKLCEMLTKFFTNLLKPQRMQEQKQNLKQVFRIFLAAEMLEMRQLLFEQSHGNMLPL